jgi:signal transduction histidine kinase
MNTADNDRDVDPRSVIAELRLQVAECSAARDAASAREVALTEVLNVINRSPGNLTPVFDAILERAMRLCRAVFGLLYTYNGERWLTAATIGLPAAFAALRTTEPPPASPGTLLAQVAEGKRPVHTLDMKEEETYKACLPGARALVELGGARTVLRVPLLKEGTVVGAISIYRQEVRAFTDEEVALLENFASQAVIAMENARLLGELRSALDTTRNTLCDLEIAQANLIQAEKMASLGQLTAGIAHEIKNPLNFVNNFSEVSIDLLEELKRALPSDDGRFGDDARVEVEDIVSLLTSNLKRVAEHGKRADGIVKAMLEHSRPGSGERRAVDINTLVDEALNLAYHGARANDERFDIRLERDFDQGIAPIELNPQDMTRVFLNIFSNGFYAANKRAQSSAEAGFDPELCVTTRGVDDAVEIRVRDNGIGVPADIRDRLFQPFFTTKPPGEGTGLGLSITYAIVTKAHGGKIAVDSEVGSFTEFVVTLPRNMLLYCNDRL